MRNVTITLEIPPKRPQLNALIQAANRSMSDKVFVDTNVLLYARQPAKQPLAWHWLEALWRGRLSFRVLQEY